MTMSNKPTVERFLTALGTADVDNLKELMTKDIIAVAKGTSILSMDRDYDTIINTVGGLMQATTNGIRFDIQSMTEEDDRVSCECNGFSNLVTGVPYNNQYHFMFHFNDGKICKMIEYFDTKLVDEALGPLFQ